MPESAAVVDLVMHTRDAAEEVADAEPGEAHRLGGLHPAQHHAVVQIGRAAKKAQAAGRLTTQRPDEIACQTI
jgi:hypothetical protein